MIFVDTGALFAYVIPDDQNHQAARQWVSQNKTPLITTDYIVDETLTLMKARGQGLRATKLGELLFSGKLARIHYLTEEEVHAAWDIFRAYSDKEWSFTDCTSKVIIERLELKHAFAFDQHFRQFGTVALVP